MPEECISEWKHLVKNEIEIQIHALKIKHILGILRFSGCIEDSLKKPNDKLVGSTNKVMETLLLLTKDFFTLTFIKKLGLKENHTSTLKTY